MEPVQITTPLMAAARRQARIAALAGMHLRDAAAAAPNVKSGISIRFRQEALDAIEKPHLISSRFELLARDWFLNMLWICLSALLLLTTLVCIRVGVFHIT